MSRSAGVVENGAISNTTFFSNARPTANAVVAAKVRKIGLERALAEIPLLVDSSGSTGWREWHRRAGLEYRPMHNRLVISDSNDRVQAVIDGQGIALWDALVQNELDSGELCYLSDVALDTVGYYLVYTAPATDRAVPSPRPLPPGCARCWPQPDHILCCHPVSKTEVAD